MNARRQAGLEALGITEYLSRQTRVERVAPPVVATPPVARAAPLVATTAPVAVPQPAAPDKPTALADVATLDWEALRDRVAGCRQCPLCAERTQTVFGRGARNAAWLIVGDAPVEQEDELGEPFAGAAGQLLDGMLAAAGRSLDSVYVSNTVKCRPPGKRDPQAAEVSACAGYLARQVALLKPTIIIAAGRDAAHHLLHTDATLTGLRGQVHYYGDEMRVPVVVTYHPTHLLHTPGDKRKAWEDLLFAHQVAGGLVH